MIRTVLFDLDDTLFDHSFCAAAALAGVQTSHACFQGMPAATLEQAHAKILEELHPDVVSGKLPLDQARAERFRRLFETAGVVADLSMASAAAARYRRAYLDAWRAVAGAVAVLTALRERGISIGIVSNNLLEEQQDKVRQCGMEGCIDALVVSAEVGISKPDPRIFEVALDRLHRRANEAVMVGDSWAADIVGAAAAGIRPVWFNPGGAAPPPVPPDVTELASFEPVDAAIEKILGD